MKKLTVLMFGVVIIAIIVLSSLIDTRVSNLENGTLDSTFFAKMIQEKINPEFKTTKEFCFYQEQLVEDRNNKELKDLFMTINPALIKNVSDVCIKKYGKVNLVLFFEEYDKNQIIFDTISNIEQKDTLSLDSVNSVDTIIYVYKNILNKE